MNTRIVLAAVFLGLLSADVVGQSTSSSAGSRLPDSVVAFVEVQGLSEKVEMVLTHPLRERLEAMPVYQMLLKSPEFTQFKAGLSLFEAGMGSRWPNVLEAATAGGVYLAFDLETEAAALLVHASDPEVLGQFRETVLPVIRGQGVGNGHRNTVKESNYRGVAVLAINNVFWADLDDWLLISSKEELGQKVVDLHLDGSQATLADNPRFARAKEDQPSDALAWGFFDVAAIRESGRADELYSGRTENIFAEMLFGGIVANLQHTDLSSAALNFEQDEIAISIRSPHQPGWVGEDREHFFGEHGTARAPDLAKTSGFLGGMSLYRDLSQMWLRASDLLTDKAVEQMAQAESQLALFFSGKDFGEDILGALKPQIQLVTARQDFENVWPRPAIKLPAFALKFEMIDPEVASAEFRRVFQSLIGFLNVISAMQGQPQFDFEWDKGENVEAVSAKYVDNLEPDEAGRAPINFNFSPAVVFSGKHMVVSSTRQLALEIVEGAQLAESLAGDVATPQSMPNTLATLEGRVLLDVLQDNWEQLVAQNQLEKGHGRKEAEAEIGLLLELLGFFDRANLELGVSSDHLELRAVLKVKDGSPGEGS